MCNLETPEDTDECADMGGDEANGGGSDNDSGGGGGVNGGNGGLGSGGGGGGSGDVGSGSDGIFVATGKATNEILHSKSFYLLLSFIWTSGFIFL